MVVQSTKRDDVCRLLVIGSSRARLNRIFSSLTLQLTSRQLAQQCEEIRIEYLPCIATFSSYKNESGSMVRYLESVEYYLTDSNGLLAATSSSLLPFFDQDNFAQDKNLMFPLIAGVAIGSGIEGSDDTAHIDAFIQTMLSGNKDPIKPIVRTCKPSPEYKSMSDELSAYRQLSDREREEMNRLKTMGPEKMVKFVLDFTNELIQLALEKRKEESDKLTIEIEALNLKVETTSMINAPRNVDESKNRYLCRICRTVLFGEDDLQYPLHEMARHNFSYRKVQHHHTVDSFAVDRCQSYFLQDSLKWMGDDINNGVSEGKFNCPKCSAKVGAWVWSGTQCSCGTWVVPAIQIPKSKVDVVRPSTVTSAT